MGRVQLNREPQRESASAVSTRHWMRHHATHGFLGDLSNLMGAKPLDLAANKIYMRAGVLVPRT